MADAAAMRAGRRQNGFLDVRLPMCVAAALIGLYAPDAVAASIFAGCWYAESRVMHEVLQDLGLPVEELNAARSDRSRNVIGREARETLACDFQGEGEILDLFLGDPEEAARSPLQMEQFQGVTLAVDALVLFGERTQDRWRGPPVPGSPHEAEE